MSKNLQSVDKLSEFPPLSPELDDSGVNFIFNFFKFGKDRSSEPRDVSESRDTTPVADVVPRELENLAKNQTDISPTNADSTSISPSLSVLYEDIGVGRSLPNVLKRISNLVAMKNTGLQSYKDSNFKQYWMPDSVSKECYDCGERFTTWRRRHHCRVCGQIFCSRCCKEEISGKILGCTGNLKVCSYCGKVVLKYLQSSDIGAELTADLRALQEDLQLKFGKPDDNQAFNVPQNLLTPAEKRTRRKHSFQEDRVSMNRMGSMSSSSQFLTTEDLRESEDLFRSPLQYAIQGGSLSTLLEEMKNPENGLPIQMHRLKLKSHQNCFMGTQFVDWLLSQNKSTTMAEAVGVGQALLEGGHIECISHPSDANFHDGNALYRLFKHSDSPFQARSNSMKDVDRLVSYPESDTISIPSTSSTYYLDLDVSESKVQLRRPRVETKKDVRLESSSTCGDTICISKEFLKDTLFVESPSSRELVPSMGWHKVQHLRTDNGEREAYLHLSEAFEKHEENLLKQLLQTEGLNESWAFSIKPLVHQIVDLVRPDVKNEDDFMDIRQYVRFKKVPGGSRSECKMVSGAVFTKHVAHREMSTKMTNPKILLLCCSISYARVEGKYVSLEPLILQEKDYLKNVVARIVNLKPQIVLVENTVSRLAQEMLLKHKITLILNVKTVVLDRIARLTQADKVMSIDATVGKPTLGMCHNFSVQRFQLDNGQTKFLMFFDGCATHLGCSVLLRGGSALELKKIKKIMQHLVLVNYSWRREKSFLMDEFAMPPQPPPASSPVKTELFASNSLSETIMSDEVFERQNEEESFTDPLQVESPESPSDPLQQYLKAATSFDEDQLQTSIISAAPSAESCKFKDALEKIVLSSSPLVNFKVPFLETEEGARSRLRRFFPEHVFWSPLLLPEDQQKAPPVVMNGSSMVSEAPNYTRDPHPFIDAKLTQPIDSAEVQAMLANFRAVGRRLRHPNEPAPDNCEPIKPKITEPNEVVPQDALSPYNHQKLAFLLCSFSPESNNAPEFCVEPWIVNMEIYGNHDIPLGRFLEEYCFRQAYKCPSKSCATPMLRHIRRFVHDGGCVQVTLKQLENQIPVEGNSILTWSWCVVCKQVSPVVPLSVDTWTLSLAKYLELRFHSPQYTRRGREATCPHSLHHQHHQYFGFKDIIAAFKYSKVPAWQISLPPTVIEIPFKASEDIQAAAVEEIKQLALKGYDVFSSVVEKLCDIGVEADPAKKEELSKLKSQLNKDNSAFKTKIEDIQIKLTSPRLDESTDMRERLWDIEDSLMYLKRMIAEAVLVWNNRLAEVTKKRDEKTKKSVSENSKAPSESEQPPESSQQTLSFEGEAFEEGATPSENLQISSVDAMRAESTPLPNFHHSGSDELWVNSVENIKKISSLDVEAPLEPKCLSYSGNYDIDDDDDLPSDDDENCFIKETDASDMQVKGHERSYSEGAAGTVSDGPSVKLEKKSSNQNQTSVKQIISQLMTSTTNAYVIQSPLGICEHHMLPFPLGPPVVVNTNEPSSIIAYALSSTEYNRKLAEGRGISNLDVPLASELVASGESMTSTKRTVLSFLRGGSPNLNANRMSGGSKASEHDTAQYSVTEENFQEEKQRTSSIISNSAPESTIEVQFNDYSTTFHCRVFFADQFSRLRELVCPDGEDCFIRSLASCVHWAARGGKSGSTFCKTKDDRFVLKEMTQNEAQLFLEVAPHYLAYLRRCLESGQPTLLGKIVGAFRVSHRSLNSSASNKTHLLVMENLFYGRTVTQRFDLKGSVRNRLVDTSGANAHGEESVLLDENLIRMYCESPLYVFPHCKKVLTLAIERDTQFLASQGVMDYSLLVGLDEQSKELVFGIIDYVRLFTWDKKIETMVKSSGILGGQGKAPTIVNPEEYRTRFRLAMKRYFLPVPDRWSGLRSDVEGAEKI